MSRTPRFTYEGEGEERLDRILVEYGKTIPELSELSRSQMKRLVEEGEVFIDGKAATKAGALVRPGAEIHVRAPAPLPVAPVPYSFPLAALHEDDDLIVLDKPSGLTVHPGAGNRDETLVNALMARFATGVTPELFREGARPGIVHRLDRDTTGVLVVAKTPLALFQLGRQFHDRTVQRTYLALALSSPRRLRGVDRAEEGVIDAPIARHPTKRLLFSVNPEGKRAVTRWRVVERMTYATLLEVRLETGRTHQIRVHLASIGSPVLGDPVYGDFTSLPPKLLRLQEDFGRQALHAQALSFTHPRTGERLSFRTPPPPDLLALKEAFAG